MVCLLLWIAALIFIVAVWPLYGVKDAEDVADPAKILPAMANHPILALFNALDMPVAVCLLLVARGLRARMPRLFSAALARAAVLVSAGCFFTLGALRLGGFAWLASLYARDPAAAASTYTDFYALQSGLDAAAIFALGCWLALTSRLGLRSGQLPAILAYYGLVTAAAALVGSAVRAVQPISLALVLVWFGWLGVVLLHAERSVGNPRSAASRALWRG
jgi:hypothetical protein